MPRILSYTPAWLGHGSPGSSMFAPPSGKAGDQGQLSGSNARRAASDRPSSSGANKSTTAQDGNVFGLAPASRTARRTVAQRGTEVFVAIGNKIHWADLAMLKEGWEEQKQKEKMKSRGKQGEEEADEEDDPIGSSGFKTLKVGVYEPIRQLIPSPNQSLLAIVTSHTVHIAILPNSIHLDQPDAGPLKVRTFTLGPTIHVLSQASVVCALWHPLSPDGDCLVTVTSDAVVRLWEVSIQNRSSFDAPTLDMDLAKLHYATSSSDSIASHRMGHSRGFSMDRIGMRAAAAAFGGSGSDAEHGWSAMTFWVAMTEGDVYALCPLLPTKWRAPSDLVPSLTTTIIARKSYAGSNDAHEEERRIFAAQQAWLSDVDEQEPVRMIGQDTRGYEWRMPIYSRPTAVSSVPKLQGPFRILPGDVEDDLELSGVHVIPPKMDREELADEDDLVDMYQDGLSTTIVCLISTTGRVYVTLCLEEIEGQWLPLQKPETRPQADPDAQPELILLEALDTLREAEVTELEWPMVTSDVFSRYAFFITHSQGVFYLSLEPWLQRLEDELQSEEPTGTGFRMNVLAKGAATIRERVQKFEHLAGTPLLPASAALVFEDSDLGYMVLTSYGARPQSTTLAPPDSAVTEEPSATAEASASADGSTSAPQPQTHLADQLTAPPRQPFQPPALFWNQSTSLPGYLSTHMQGRNKIAQSGPLRLTEQTLEVLTQVHRDVARETHSLGTATAEVFRRCERLTAELADQVRRVRDCKIRLDQLLGEDADAGPQGTSRTVRQRLEERLEEARERKETLQERHEALRRKVVQLGARPLSEVEVAWRREVDKLAAALDEEEEEPARQQESRTAATGAASRARPAASQRYDVLRSTADGVLADVRRSSEDNAQDGGDGEAEGSPYTSAKPKRETWHIPPELRTARLDRVRYLLDREEKMVEGVRERLARLGA